MITIRDFANEKGCTVQNVYKLIKKYSSNLDGHVRKVGSKTFLDDYAQMFLSSYITPKSTVASNNELMDEINRLRGLLSEADHKNSELIAQNSELLLEAQNFNFKQLLLEQDINTLEEEKKSLQLQCEALEKDRDNYQKANQDLNDKLLKSSWEIQDLEKEVSKRDEANWIQRLFKKW